MQHNLQIFCSRCGAFTHHVSQGRYDTMGALKAVDERCGRCGHVAEGHEVPRDADMGAGGLTTIEIMRCRYQQWLLQTGRLSEWTGEPGV